MTTTQIENINIKKVLKKEFPNYKISVRQERGTASGWKQITIETDIKEERQAVAYGSLTREVVDKFKEIENKAREIVHQNSQVNTFTSDDGYGSEYDCILVNVRGVWVGVNG
jgi:hypothetical protein